MKQPIPEWLSSKRVSKPSLASSLSFYYKAFSDLCSEREFAEVCLSLKYSCIKKHAEYYELDSDQEETFIFLMQKMDNAYVRSMLKRGESKRDNQTI